jgi:hypothetical protein
MHIPESARGSGASYLRRPEEIMKTSRYTLTTLATLVLALTPSLALAHPLSITSGHAHSTQIHDRTPHVHDHTPLAHH